MENKDFRSTDLDDIIFEGRNKAYGAYTLRKMYSKHVTRGTILASVFFLLLMFSPLIISKLQAALAPVEEVAQKDVVIEELPPPPPDEEQPPPPPPPPPPPQRPTIQFLPPKIMDDNKVKNEIPPPPPDSIKKTQVAANTQTGDPNAGQTIAPPTPPPPPPPDDPPPPPKPKDDEVFTVVEQRAEFPDGEAAMYKYLGANIKYPAIARENGITGKVIVEFVVEKDGSITSPVVRRGIGGGCDEEALRVIKSMPKWSPGKQQGNAVRSRFTLPVKFTLQ